MRQQARTVLDQMIRFRLAGLAPRGKATKTG